MNRLYPLSLALLALLFVGCVSYDRPRHYKTAPRPKHLPAWGQTPPPQPAAHPGPHAPKADVPPKR